MINYHHGVTEPGEGCIAPSGSCVEIPEMISLVLLHFYFLWAF